MVVVEAGSASFKVRRKLVPDGLKSGGMLLGVSEA